MSGLFGIVRFDGQPVDHADLERMRQSMAHRGPDGSEVWVQGSTGLGQLMLHTTPESLYETLPWQDTDSGLVITADARLDNREELILDLGLKSGGEQISDSQLILYAFRKWGRSCVERLLGDFSFVVWDPVNRRLFCVRDAMGIRPFYYFHSRNLFVFASSANAVVSVRAVPMRPDEGRIADLLVHELEGYDTKCTFYKDVFRMPPAFCGVVERGETTFHRYWRPDPDARLKLADDREYIEGLEEVLTDAIQARMRCQLPTASMLSGGVDSSTIVGIAAKLSKKGGGGPFKTFSGVSQSGEDCVESEYIRKVVDYGGIDPVSLNPDRVEEYLDDFQRIESVLEDPFDLNWTLLQMLYLTARKQGHVVLMDGIDGDGVASLTKLYPAYLMRRGKIMTALKEIDGQRAHFYRADGKRLLFYRHAVRTAAVPNFLRQARQSANESRWLESALKNSWISKDFADRVNLRERYHHYSRKTHPGMRKSLRHAHADRLVVPFLTAGIERYGRIAAYCGMEQRQPYLDKRVIEYCLALPWDLKVRDGWTKYALRNVTEQFGPHSVAWRPGWEQIGWKFKTALQKRCRVVNLELIESSSRELREILASRFFTEIVARYSAGESEVIEPMLNVVAYIKWRRKLEIRDSVNGSKAHQFQADSGRLARASN